MLKLLCVTAHPDDEAGCFGGVLKKYSEAGVHCSVLCLTAGERAANRGGLVEDEALKVRRREEFAASCRHLGVHEGRVLNYRDGALDREDFHSVAGEIVRTIRSLRPDVVATFAAEGFVTAHTDHGMAGLYAAAAFQWAARSTRYREHFEEGLETWRARKLYAITTEFSMPERQPVSLAPVTARVFVGPWVERKIEAFALHTTQRPLLPIFANAQKKAGEYELFHLLATSEVTPMKMESDLFEGIREM